MIDGVPIRFGSIDFLPHPPAPSDKAGDMKDRIWRGLVQLHAIDKKKPTEKFMGKE
jgi:hypothetical protein